MSGILVKRIGRFNVLRSLHPDSRYGTIQVRSGGHILRSYRFDRNSLDSMERAIEKAEDWIQLQFRRGEA